MKRKDELKTDIIPGNRGVDKIEVLDTFIEEKLRNDLSENRIDNIVDRAVKEIVFWKMRLLNAFYDIESLVKYSDTQEKYITNLEYIIAKQKDEIADIKKRRA